ncbi:MAG: molybdenum ABC transporter ATP-binding protein [Gammaproteobacteria bacterium]|nr:molybdenum ABC transporter ATP-binding protein [Gammaproteobacteria bacterium]NNF49824.1 molybdenum ABC transporter ATP-binding protein [Woeseiaceae bacterium]MBT8093624.1 molybdenum ABC transporter ATP-binding protein [Gammaproteobacteria bacterium]MBT8105652.1 molybdenum ABC transporter ATP-binding protein [Gammaproteobacteria bacterium]NNK25666.1 molybdenum ABC transporter ATP-binding protein [Woeseiaceae bacterium]
MIRLQHTVRRGSFVLDVDAEIPDAGVTGVFGASGSGKTTLLRCIAGLEGEGGPPVHQRNIGYVFQQPTLFPHLDVRRNLDYGARRSGSGRVDASQVIDMLGLGDLLTRRPDTLSGGEAQRVAIGAALMRSPDLVLMDEPLASLDRRRKDELLPYFDRLHDELSIPVVYVSHDIDEVSRLCDHLFVLEDGRVVANGDLFETLARVDIPQLGGRNAGVVLWATPVDHAHGLTRFDFGDGDIWAPGKFAISRNAMRLRIAASDVSIVRERPVQTTILNVLPATIENVHSVDEATALIRLGVGNQRLLAQVTNRSIERLGLQDGERVFAQLKSVTVRR